VHTPSVLISGAGIAGLALAHWLTRYGYEVTVVEQSPGLRRGGQAVDLRGRTHLAALDHLGIRDDVFRRRTGTTDTVLVDAAGRPLATIPAEFTGGDVEILRGDLVDILHDRVLHHAAAGRCDLVFGDRVTSLTETADGVRVTLAGGAEHTVDLVVGADGIHSRVRSLTFGPERELVRHLGRYYCIAGTSQQGAGRPNGAVDPGDGPPRITAYGHNTPGRHASWAGPGTQQFYVFAAPEVELPQDVAGRRRLVTETFSGMGWQVPAMLQELAHEEEIYLDSISRVEMGAAGFARGRVALLGDAGYGNTLGGSGTGLALVGAYTLAGELAVADGDHTVAFARYEQVMRRYVRLQGAVDAGRFLAPRTARGLRFRDAFLRSRAFGLMQKLGQSEAELDLPDYPAIAGVSGAADAV
jgi:2-polyprenyl-6-methoxyphenol hydroxylase-like FAD-dependent oxidoreductase